MVYFPVQVACTGCLSPYSRLGVSLPCSLLACWAALPLLSRSGFLPCDDMSMSTDVRLVVRRLRILRRHSGELWHEPLSVLDALFVGGLLPAVKRPEPGDGRSHPHQQATGVQGCTACPRTCCSKAVPSRWSQISGPGLSSRSQPGALPHGEKITVPCPALYEPPGSAERGGPVTLTT